MLILNESEIHELVTPADALEQMRQCFAAHERGAVQRPHVIALDFPDAEGDVHVKGSFIEGTSHWAIKAASTFNRNAQRGKLPHSGLSLVFSARTGYAQALLLDNGFLTDLRTGAAGALAADLLARPDVRTVGVIGSGNQARFQVEALLGVRSIEQLRVFSRTRSRADRYAIDMRTRFGLRTEAVESAELAVRDADIVILTTPARVPVVNGSWLKPGAHVNAVGSDTPGKRELDAEGLARAAVVVVDDVDQATIYGEWQYSPEVQEPPRVETIGAVLRDPRVGRQGASDITVADLTGIGAQDAAIASFVYERAVSVGCGRTITASGTEAT